MKLMYLKNSNKRLLNNWLKAKKNFKKELKMEKVPLLSYKTLLKMQKKQLQKKLLSQVRFFSMSQLQIKNTSPNQKYKSTQKKLKKS
jgi:hypothetical protein